jgi:hypothetical protein
VQTKTEERSIRVRAKQAPLILAEKRVSTILYYWNSHASQACSDQAQICRVAEGVDNYDCIELAPAALEAVKVE